MLGVSRLAAMREGLREVLRSEVILPVILAQLGSGVLFVAAYAVLLPLIVLLLLLRTGLWQRETPGAGARTALPAG